MKNCVKRQFKIYSKNAFCDRNVTGARYTDIRQNEAPHSGGPLTGGFERSILMYSVFSDKWMRRIAAGIAVPMLVTSTGMFSALAMEYDISVGDVHVEKDETSGDTKSWQDNHESYNSKENGYNHTEKEDNTLTIKQSDSREDADANQSRTDGEVEVNEETSGADKEATENTVHIGDGVSDLDVTLDDVNIKADDKDEAAVTVGNGADVNLELDGENKLAGGDNAAGLNVKGEAQDEEGNVTAEAGSVTITDRDQNGSLTANGGETGSGSKGSGAGIGGNAGENGGSITIDGGTIEANGGEQAAGIGGGYQSANGSVTINDGDVTANGGTNAAGIGGGAALENSDASYKESYDRNGGEINIHGGKVTANGGGGNGGAGIGGGSHGDGGKITIDGGEVTAQGGSGGAGIGSGTGSHKQDSAGNKGPGAVNGGEITISGDAAVTATGGWNAAGIGGGYCADSGEITINGGTVNAYGTVGNDGAHYQGGAGIGGGYEGHGNVTINGGAVHAQAVSTNGTKNAAAGIGSGATANDRGGDANGRGDAATHPQTTVTIAGGKIVAVGGATGGAGIGGGFGADRVEIVISGGDITAKGGESSFAETAGGAGIGGGCNSRGIKDKYASETKVTVKILDGVINAIGGWGASGIGSGADNLTAQSIEIGKAARVQAFSDGIKFAIDSYNRNQNTVNNIKGGNLLQGTFMVVGDAQTNGFGEIGYGDYSSLYVVVYRDANPDSANSALNAYETPVIDGLQLPAGYRSFAVTVDEGGNYLVHGSKEGFEAWFGFDVTNAQETAGNDNRDETGAQLDQTGHYNTNKDGSMSDNYWLYEMQGGNVVIVPDPVPSTPPAPNPVDPNPNRPDDSDTADERVDIPDDDTPRAETPDVPVEITDDPVPLSEAPEPLTEITEDLVPLSDTPAEITEITDAPVPMAEAPRDDVPKTGDESSPLGLLAASLLSAMAAAVSFGCSGRKKHN